MAVRGTLLVGAALLLLVAGVGTAAEIASHLSNMGPAFEAEMTPKTLGWGDDTKAYPQKFVVNPKDGAEMVWVPAGEFNMGSGNKEQEAAFRKAREAMGDYAERKWFTDEKPVHPVKLTAGFWMYRHEVTNAQMRKFRPKHDSKQREGVNLNGDRQPAVQVTHDLAADYCAWAGAELASEAQWEYACRAGSDGTYWWTDPESETGMFANVPDKSAKTKWPDWVVFDAEDGHVGSAPVGSFKLNEFGLCDMIGNAAEWCADWYQADYYASSPEKDPPGPDDGGEAGLRVVRGGSFYSPMYDCRCASRGGRDPSRGYEWLGFRAIILP